MFSIRNNDAAKTAQMTGYELKTFRQIVTQKALRDLCNL